jgi:hypothetical protein
MSISPIQSTQKKYKKVDYFVSNGQLHSKTVHMNQENNIKISQLISNNNDSHDLEQ